MKFGLVVLVGLLGLSQVAHAFTAEALLGLAVFAKVWLSGLASRKCLIPVKFCLRPASSLPSFLTTRISKARDTNPLVVQDETSEDRGLGTASDL